MAIDYLGILACGVASMILGFVWFGPLFGKKWLQVVGASGPDAERRKEMQKGMGKLYVTAFVLALLQAYVLSLFIAGVGLSIALKATALLWAGLVLPVVAGASMWNNDSAKISWTRFLIQAPYYLILMLIFSFILAR